MSNEYAPRFHMCDLKRVKLQDWANATSVARAFALGKLESEAVFNLRLRVPSAVLTVLVAAVKQRGMAKLLTHEVIAKDCFNQSFTSGINTMDQWREELRNREGNELAAGLAMGSVTIVPLEFQYVLAHVFRPGQLYERLYNNCVKRRKQSSHFLFLSSGPSFCGALAQ